MTLKIGPEFRYGIEMWIGEPRSGKTLDMVRTTYLDKLKDPSIKIFTNIWLSKDYFPRYEFLSMETLAKFHKYSDRLQNCIILVDETHQFFDSRNFMKKSQKHMTHLLGMCGKRNITLRGTTHFFINLDYRLRQYTEKKVFITKGLVAGSQWKPILNNNRKLNKEENDRLYIKAESFVRKLIGYEFVTVPIATDFVKAIDYFNMYDTEELVVADKQGYEYDLEKDKVLGDINDAPRENDVLGIEG